MPTFVSLLSARDLLDQLIAWATQPRFVYRHAWSLGDLVMWDNTGLLHRVQPYPADSGRLMHRVPYDVITELSYDSETAFRRTLAYLSTSALPDELVEDEKRLFDRSRQRMATVVEHSTPL